MSRRTLEKSSKEYFEEIASNPSYTKDRNHLVSHAGYDPKEVSPITDHVSITAHDGVMDAIVDMNYVINVTQDLESIAQLTIGVEPYAKDIEDNLDLIALAIHQKVQRDWKVTVHCAMGMERSCLAVAWYLSKFGGMSLDRAYEVVRRGRPIAIDRRSYLEQG